VQRVRKSLKGKELCWAKSGEKLGLARTEGSEVVVADHAQRRVTWTSY